MLLRSYSSVYCPWVSCRWLLLWLYASWVLVLLGAEIAHALQNLRVLEAEDRRQRDDEPINGLLAALAVGGRRRHARGRRRGHPAGPAGDGVRVDPAQRRSNRDAAEGARPHRRGPRRHQRLHPGPGGVDDPAGRGSVGLPFDRHRAGRGGDGARVTASWSRIWTNRAAAASAASRSRT